MNMEEVRKWIQEKYPFLAANDDFAVRLYKQEVLKEQLTETRVVYPPVTSIKYLQVGVPATVVGKPMVNGQRRYYNACKTCGRKNCDNPMHEGAIQKSITPILIGDQTDVIHAVLFNDASLDNDLEEINEAFAAVFVGTKYKSSYSGDFELRVNTWEFLTNADHSALTSIYEYFLLNDNPRHILLLTNYNNYIDSIMQKNSSITSENIAKAEKYLVASRDNDYIYMNIIA